ncbi:hypothetical protein HDU92_002133 [Lobulomyces angularis]|nr:hypothetical protein HDU92_002133 [Lobulomyces angularis]
MYISIYIELKLFLIHLIYLNVLMFTPIKSKRIIQKTPKSSVRLSPPIPKKEQKSDSNNNSSVVQNIHKIQERSKVFYNSEKFKVISRQKGPLNFNLTDEINLDANFTLHQNFMTISTQSSFIVFNWKLNEYLNSFDIEDKQLSVLFDNGELLLFSSNVFKYIKNIAYNNDSTITFYVTLEQHEFGIKLLNFNPIGYILVTNFGNVFKIVLNERKEFKVVKFSKDLSSFGLNSLVNSVSSFLTYLPQEKNDLGILNVISGEINGKSRQLLILLKEEIQIWSVSKSHEQMSYRIKLKDLILEKELTIFNLERTSIEFLAFDFNESERKIVVLISVDKKKLHQLSFNPNIENFKVDHIQLQTFLNYNKTLNQERIELFNVQGTSFIFFSQALLVLNNSKLSPSSQELICFNEDIICHYVDKSKLTRGQDNTENCLIYFQKAGVVSIDAIIKNFVSYDRKVALYKQIEQAVFYGNQVDENPIDFVIFPQEDDLNMSCVELVDNILNGKSVYIQDDFEIKNYIFEQENIFKNLVDYLNALGIYNQVSLIPSHT